MVERSGPDFLGIGAQKAGTTWLYEMLKTHPDIWLPPHKELHYFTRSDEYSGPSWFNQKWWPNRLFGSGKEEQAYRRLLKERLKENLRNPTISQASWDLHFLFGQCSDSWYCSLFRKEKGQIAGEITPDYSILDKPGVEKVHKLLPEVKLVFIIRDPIERAWSYARFSTKFTGRSLDNIDAQKKLFESDFLRERGNYTKTIDTWSAVFPEEQIFLGFYDDIKQKPIIFLDRLFQFLEVQSTLTESFKTEKRPNASPQHELPAELEVFLAREYIGQISELARRFGGHANSWLARAEGVLSASSTSFKKES